MPWDLGRSCHGHGQEQRWQKRCKKSSFAFYQAVRDLLPVWMLEEMRTLEVFHWEESGRMSSYSPSEALLYALVHDHQPYGQYLLSKHPRAALAMPSKSFCCCQSLAPHLAMAVRYNRIVTLGRILKSLRHFPESERRQYLNRRGCEHVESGKTPLHLACELARPECLTLLLGHGSSPYIPDCEGNTALDTLLGQLCDSPLDSHRKNSCLHNLLLFMPEMKFKMKGALKDNASLWQSLLGTDIFRWLSGYSPPPLFIKAMQTLIGAIAPEKFPEGLDELPISHLLTVEGTTHSNLK
ncbi:ankyrin repeat domain-containing protein 9-like [Carcharodon carcharias]|uniref:ankyrin repeat domain-containing protein 9-like n=1 Tax=Carcharodon carcharias TaxID=13397 RepID=UPI001B7EDF0B|nr:ankyrin repeat domain-containing protein 9-like [Carcharodon carcharias]